MLILYIGSRINTILGAVLLQDLFLYAFSTKSSEAYYGLVLSIRPSVCYKCKSLLIRNYSRYGDETFGICLNIS